jgi:hypothetical protein
MEGGATMVAASDILSPAHVAGATPLLQHLAGEFAGSIAHVWRAPHGEFLALPAARRHAAALALAGFAKALPGAAELRRLLEFGRDAVVSEMLAGEAVPGLMRTLAKMGEVLWTRADYRAFLELFAEPAANEALRHMERVEADRLKTLALLPAPLRTASVLKELPGEAAAGDLALAFRLAQSMRDAQAIRRLTERWTSGGELQALMVRAREDLTPEVFTAATPPPNLARPFQRIISRRGLEALALEFRNCLADYAARAAEGKMAVYVWRIDRPAAIALNRDAAGWRLAEAKLVDNNDLEEGDLRTLVTHLAGHKVRTGPSLEVLGRRLEEYAYGSSYWKPAQTFVGRLELGDLWS